MNYTEAENIVYEATNEDPWGPTGPQMKEIASCTFQYDGFNMVTNLLWKRMLEDNKMAWRRVSKTILDLLSDDDKIPAQRKKVKFDCKDRYQGSHQRTFLWIGWIGPSRVMVTITTPTESASLIDAAKTGQYGRYTKKNQQSTAFFQTAAKREYDKIETTESKVLPILSITVREQEEMLEKNGAAQKSTTKADKEQSIARTCI
ncbi:Clathrin interactor 1 [Parelaphostrongylus tenuis]|uniref:Clathrin interactor 1 n=1 Tax=Parelaphostrongylus tenuis TaxID=148309 RepID=A0AAD5LVF6_PARTN|nr:Clathrin interactor 1 [Parelaphostrongylus tenuis]